MKTTSSQIPRQKLLSVLAQYGIAPAAFDALRADAYEKHIATHSLEDLERLYATILDPALGYAQMQPLCPRWPSGRLAGRLPGLQTLCDIKHRLMAEQTLNDLDRMEKLLKNLRHRTSAQSVELQTEMFNAVIAMLGEELLAAKLDGQPIMENLRVVDRLLKVSALRLRQQQAEARQKLQERREDRLDRRSERAPASSQEDPDEYEEEDDNSGLTEREKAQRWIESVYGPKPGSMKAAAAQTPPLATSNPGTTPPAQCPQKN